MPARQDQVVLAVRWRGQDWALVEGEDLSVGRVEEADIVLGSAAISRAHARFTTTGGRTMVEDLQSRNGVYVNGARITEPTPISLGDRVAIGEAILLVVRGREESSGERTRSSRPSRPSHPLAATAGHDVFAVFISAVRDGLAEDLADATIAARHLYDSLVAPREQPVTRDLVREAAHVFADVATATQHPEWLDRVFEILRVHRVPLDAVEMQSLARLAIDLGVPPDTARHDYLAWLRSEPLTEEDQTALAALMLAGSR